MAGLRDSTLELLKHDLGRDVSQEGGSCRDYMDVYNSHLEDVRKLAPLHAEKYIRYLLGGGARLGNAKLFVYFVAKEGMDIGHWMKNYYESE